MAVEENKILARRLIDTLNGRDLTTLDEIATPDLALHFKERTIPFIYATFGDHRAEITDMVAAEDKVWLRLATSGGHTAEWMGIAPTGKQWTNTGVYFLRVANGKICELSSLFDNLNLLEQLGASLMRPDS